MSEFKQFTPPPRQADDAEIAFEGSAVMPRVAKVAPIGPMTIAVTWTAGGADSIDLSGLISRHSSWSRLADPAQFGAVALVDGGIGIGWSDGPDISARALATMAEVQRGWTGENFAAWMDRMDLSFRAAAEVLDVAPSTIHEQRRKDHVDRTLMLAARAIEADPIAFDAVVKPRPSGRPRRPKFSDFDGVWTTDTRSGAPHPESRTIFAFLIAPDGGLQRPDDAARTNPCDAEDATAFGISYWHRDDQGFWRQAWADWAPDPITHHRKMKNVSDIARCQLLLVYPLQEEASAWKENALVAFNTLDLADLPERKNETWISSVHLHDFDTDLAPSRVRNNATFGEIAPYSGLEIKKAAYRKRMNT